MLPSPTPYSGRRQRKSYTSKVCWKHSKPRRRPASVPSAIRVRWWTTPCCHWHARFSRRQHGTGSLPIYAIRSDAGDIMPADSIRTDAASVEVRLADYRPPAFLIDTVELPLDLSETETTVVSNLAVRRSPAAPDASSSNL